MGRRRAAYTGASEADVNDLWSDDHQRIQAAGWVQAGPARWAADATFTLFVEYEFQPPAQLLRPIMCPRRHIAATFADDAQRMAWAGYAPEEQTWRDGLPTVIERTFLTSPQHWTAPGKLEIRYSFRPDLVGEPTRSIPPLPGGRAPRWTNVPEHRRRRRRGRIPRPAPPPRHAPE